MRLRYLAGILALGLGLMLGGSGCSSNDPIADANKDVVVAPSATSYEASVQAQEEQQKQQEALDRQR